MMPKGRKRAVRWKLVEKFCASLLILVLCAQLGTCEPHVLLGCWGPWRMNVCNGIFPLILVFPCSYDKSWCYRRTSLMSTPWNWMSSFFVIIHSGFGWGHNESCLYPRRNKARQGQTCWIGEIKAVWCNSWNVTGRIPVGALGSAWVGNLLTGTVSPLLSEDGEQHLVLTKGLLNLLHKRKEGRRYDVLMWWRIKWFCSEILWRFLVFLVLQLGGSGACGAVLLTEVSAEHCLSAVSYWRWRRDSLQWVHFHPV